MRADRPFKSPNVCVMNQNKELSKRGTLRQKASFTGNDNGGVPICDAF